jgi:hypothetical protein
MSDRSSSGPHPALALVIGAAFAAAFALAGAELGVTVIAAVCAGGAWLALALLRRRR